MGKVLHIKTPELWLRRQIILLQIPLQGLGGAVNYSTSTALPASATLHHLPLQLV